MAIVQTKSAVPLDAPQAVVSKNANAIDAELLRRFSEHRDESAFEQMVQRHGPMVLGVCRRTMQDSHAAEDAFQATFLVLVRKAASIQDPDLLGSWLYGVAYRTACRARAQAVKRDHREMRTAIMPETDVNNEIQRREFRVVLDEEINRLPEKYREAFVLCHLQEKTHAEAARLLGCPVGSMSSRLERAREKLKSRLSRRGVSLTAGVFAAILLESTARSEVSTKLIDVTVRNAMSIVMSQGVTGTVPSRIVDLASDASRRTPSRTLCTLMVLLLLLLGTSLLTYRAPIFAEANVTPSGQNVPEKPALEKTALETTALETTTAASVFALPAGDAPSASRATSDNSGSCCR